MGPSTGWDYPTHFNHEHSQENDTDRSNMSSYYSQYILEWVDKVKRKSIVAMKPAL